VYNQRIEHGCKEKKERSAHVVGGFEFPLGRLADVRRDRYIGGIVSQSLGIFPRTRCTYKLVKIISKSSPQIFSRKSLKEA